MYCLNVESAVSSFDILSKSLKYFAAFKINTFWIQFCELSWLQYISKSSFLQIRLWWLTLEFIKILRESFLWFCGEADSQTLEKLMCLTFQYSFFYWNSIADIIEHYRKEQIVEGYYLKDPVPMQVGFNLQPFDVEVTEWIIIKSIYELNSEVPVVVKQHHLQ